MSGSPLIFVRDSRALPFVPVTYAALDAITAAVEKADGPKRLAAARSLYLALLELAGRARSDRAPASRKALGEAAGISRDLVSDLRPLLEGAGVVKVVERHHDNQRLENEWVLTDPVSVPESEHPMADSHDPRGPQPQRKAVEEGLEEDSSLRSESGAAGRARAKELKSRLDVTSLCDSLASYMLDEDPQAKTLPGRLEWLEQAGKLLDEDERHYEEVAAVMQWAFHDPFWIPLIHSMRYFRLKYPTLRGQWLKSKRPKPGSYVQSAAAAQHVPSSAELAAAFARSGSPDGDLRRRTGAR